eukprot:g5380.t1
MADGTVTLPDGEIVEVDDVLSSDDEASTERRVHEPRSPPQRPEDVGLTEAVPLFNNPSKSIQGRPASKRPNGSFKSSFRRKSREGAGSDTGGSVGGGKCCVLM